MTNWREAMENSPEKFISTQNEQGETIGIINQHPNGSALVTGDADIPAQHASGIDRALEELNLHKEQGWQ